MKYLIIAFFLSACVVSKQKPIPVITYDAPPVGADDSRMMKSERLALYDLVEDPYGNNEDTRWKENVGAVLDGYAARIMAKEPGKRVFEEWHIAGSLWMNPYLTLLFHPRDGCRDQSGALQMYTDFNNRVRPYACPWFDHGKRASYAKWKFIMSELKKRGVEIDYFSTENELSFSNWTYPQGGLEAIENDPRYQELAEEEALPLSLSNTVGKFWESAENRDTLVRWNALMANRVYEAFYEGMWKAVLEEYPHLRDKLSDYAKFQILPEYPVYDVNSWPLHRHTVKSEYLLTQGSDLNYLGCGQLCQYDLVPELRPFPNTPWNTLILALNQARGIYLSAPEKPFWPFIACNSWQKNHPLYAEFIHHIYLGGSTGFVFWNPTDHCNVNDYTLLTSTLLEADQLIGFEDRKADLPGLIDWHANEIKTCAKANGKKICRVTPKEGLGYWSIDGVRYAGK